MCVNHLAAVFSLDNDRVSVATLDTTFDDSPALNSPDRRPRRRSDIRTGVVSRLTIDRVTPPAFRRTNNAVDRQHLWIRPGESLLGNAFKRTVHFFGNRFRQMLPQHSAINVGARAVSE